MFRYLIAVCAVALPLADAARADEGDTGTTRLPSFSGRSGATKIKIIVACGIPNAPPAAPEIAPPPREVTNRSGPPDKYHGSNSETVKQLRQLAEQWSGDLPAVRSKELAELLEQVPPKYRQMVKDYFEQLEKMSREKK